MLIAFVELDALTSPKILCKYPNLMLWTGCDTRSIFSGVVLVWIQLSFSKAFAVLWLKGIVYPTIYPQLGGE